MRKQAGTSSTTRADIEMEIPSRVAATDNLASQKDPASQDDSASHGQAPPTSTVVEEQRENPVLEKPSETTQDDAVIIAECHGATPEASSPLAIIVAKDESPCCEKGKADSHLQAFESLDVTSLHQRYLTRLLENRETESAMVTLMKKKNMRYAFYSLSYICM